MRRSGYRPVSAFEQILYIFAWLVRRLRDRVFKKHKKPSAITKVETNTFDKEDIYENCTSEVSMAGGKTNDLEVMFMRRD